MVSKNDLASALFPSRCDFSSSSLLKEVWHWKNNNETNFLYTSRHKKIYMERDSLMPKKKRTFQPIETFWTSFYVHQIKRVDSLIVHQKSKWLQSLEGSPKYWTDLQSTYTSTCNSDIIKGNQEIWSKIAWCPFKVWSTRVNGFHQWLSFISLSTQVDVQWEKNLNALCWRSPY
jgi:hypothetical protein